MDINWKVELEVDGKSIYLNKFANGMLASTLLGMVTPLKGVEDPQEVKVELRLVPEGEEEKK